MFEVDVKNVTRRRRIRKRRNTARVWGSDNNNSTEQYSTVYVYFNIYTMLKFGINWSM